MMNWGILGTSFISGIMARAIKSDPLSHLYAVAGRNPDTLRQFAQEHTVEKSYGSMDALIADPKVDIIYIALPNHLHHEYVIKAAQQGKAILCEKSLSIDMKKTEEALDAIQKYDVFFAEGLMYLHHPLVQAVLATLEQKTIGTIRSVQGSYVAAISQFVNPASKGALYNLGCYPVSLMHLVLKSQFGSQVLQNYRIKALGRHNCDGNICESSAIFAFNDNLTAQLHTAEDYGLKHTFTILGSKGAIHLDTNPWLPETSNQITVEIYEHSTESFKVNAEGDGFFYQVRNIRSAISAGKKSPERPSVNDSWQIMKMLTDWERAVAS